MGVMRPDLIMRSIIPVVMAGVLGSGHYVHGCDAPGFDHAVHHPGCHGWCARALRPYPRGHHHRQARPARHLLAVLR